MNIDGGGQSETTNKEEDGVSDKKWFNHSKLWLGTWFIAEIIIGVGSLFFDEKPEGRWAFFISFSVVSSFLLFLNWMYDRGEE